MCDSKESCEKKKMGAGVNSSPSGFPKGYFFFLAAFFRVTHDGLSERGTTRSCADASTLIQVTQAESVSLTLEEIFTDYLLLVFQSTMLA